MTVGTIDHSDIWNDFRTNDLSDYRPVGLLTFRTSARFSDQWIFGPTTIWNIKPSPNGLSRNIQRPMSPWPFDLKGCATHRHGMGCICVPTVWSHIKWISWWCETHRRQWVVFVPHMKWISYIGTEPQSHWADTKNIWITDVTLISNDPCDLDFSPIDLEMELDSLSRHGLYLRHI